MTTTIAPTEPAKPTDVDASPAPGLLDRLAQQGPTLARFCTPSVLPGPTMDIWAADLSISYAPAGSMLDHSGWFAEAEALIAKVQGSDGAYLAPGGSTLANQVVLRSLQRGGHAGTVLVDRQAHHSVVRGLTMFGIPWQYIERGRWDPTFECPRAVQAVDVVRTITSVDEVAAVIVVSPTYAGEVADLGGVRQAIDRHAPDAVFHVDEAWGVHLAFHSELRPHRAVLHADLVSQSTHKAGGALQPGAVLLRNDGAVTRRAVDAAYADLLSTSASFLIAASIDHAHRTLAADGEARLDRSIHMTRRLAAGLRAGIPGGRLFADAHPAAPLDPTKTTLALPAGPVTGYAVRDALAAAGIVVEKATPATITWLTTFGVDEAIVDRTIEVTAAAVRRLSARRGPARESVPDPYIESPAAPVVPPHEVVGRAAREAVSVPIDDSVGMVAAELIEAYPPGVAVISQGFRVTSGAVAWLRAVAAAGGTIVGGDGQLRALRVLPDAT